MDEEKIIRIDEGLPEFEKGHTDISIEVMVINDKWKCKRCFYVFAEEKWYSVRTIKPISDVIIGWKRILTADCKGQIKFNFRKE